MLPVMEDMAPIYMNIHVPEDIRKRWPNYEFTGKPFKLRDGKTYIRAYSKVFEVNHFYCYEDDFIWFDKNDILSV
jgi:hypothetical protein